MIDQNGAIVSAHETGSDSKRHKVYAPKDIAETPPVLSTTIPRGLRIKTICDREAGGMRLHGPDYENGYRQDRCHDCPV